MSDYYREILLVGDPAHLVSSPIEDLVLSIDPGVLLEHGLGGDLGLELLDKLLVGVVRDPGGQVITSPIIKLVSEYNMLLNFNEEDKLIS